ncbi:MAG: PIG-L family deacetylase [Saprospiraceae bacterium]|nr:PIG-L family deacetylase [Saprospiraceae bacterium]
MLAGRRILVLAPHTDDGELGCGATIVRAIEEGSDVYYVAFSTAEESVPAGFPKNQLEIEVREATEILGIPGSNLLVFNYAVRKLNYVRQELLEELIRLQLDIQPDLVFMPCLHDIHQDHSTVAMEGLRAYKNCSILGYELIWNNLSFDTDCFISINETQLDRKIVALQAYKTQNGKPFMDPAFIRSLAKVRGTQIGTGYAEAFEVIRWIF